MKYDLILFDIDDTLFDFRRSQEQAFFSAMAKQGVEACDRRLEQFRTINARLWKQFELGNIQKDQIKTERFRIYAEERRITLDPHRMSEDFLELLCETTHLVEGAQDVCAALRGKVRMGIITNGIAHVQHRRIAQSGLADHFEVVVVSEECGFQKPMPQIFDYALERFAPVDRSRVLMVGDRLDTDIEGAAASGIHSCWFNPGKMRNTTSHAPTHTIHALNQLLDI